MPANYRCKYNNIWDSTTRRYRTCKNKKCCGDFCTIHYKLMYTEHAIMIQKIYKGYYIRKKLKIYYNLPRDLQRKIIWHINSYLYLRNYNSSISKIIFNRYKEFYKKYKQFLGDHYGNYINLSVYNLTLNNMTYLNFINDLISICKITIKYIKIINIYRIPHFYQISCVTKLLITELIDKNSDDYIIFNSFYKLY